MSEIGCTCSPCTMCRGEGVILIDLRGHVVSWNDGLCDVEPCEECGGSGIESECAFCAFQRECDEDSL